jgi:hypothetical protein
LRQLGQEIRERRKQLKLSAVATSEAAFISRMTLNRIEKGEPSVTLGAPPRRCMESNSVFAVKLTGEAVSIPSPVLVCGLDQRPTESENGLSISIRYNNDMDKIVLALSFALASLLWTSNLHAERQPLECRDLNTATCLPEGLDDGTGIRRSPAETRVRTAEADERLRRNLRLRLEEFVNSEEGEHIRNTAIEAAGLDLEEDCSGDQAARCASIAVGHTEEVMLSKMGIRSAEVYRQPSLAGLMPIMENQRLAEIEQSLSNERRNSLVDRNQVRRTTEVLFPRVKNQFIELLNDLPIEDGVRRRMVAKIRNMRIQESNCAEGYGSNQATMVPNAFYFPEKNLVQICEGYLLTSSSEFKLVGVMAHEIGHALDPCNIADSGVFNYKPDSPWLDQYPIPGLARCLSQHSPTEDQENVSRRSSGYGGERGMYPGSVAPPTRDGRSNSKTFDKASCRNAHLGELCGDWFAAEILPRYVKTHLSNLTPTQIRAGYANVERGSCGSRGGPGSTHPASELRTNAIIGSHPEIRSQMGCTQPPRKRYPYCDGRTTQPIGGQMNPPNSTEANELIEDIRPIHKPRTTR